MMSTSELKINEQLQNKINSLSLFPILLGEKHVVGKGYFRAVMRLMIYFIFENLIR